VVLFSGGTDSTCSAALCADKFESVHLLTFYEKATARSPVPIENISRLRNKYGAEKFIHRMISTDRLVEKISYEKYFSHLFRFGFYMLSTPGFSSLSWHVRTIRYCLQNEIRFVFDGMTKELMHFPGHMPEIREIFARLYASFGITFTSPVISWDVPADQRFIDRLIVDRHGFSTHPSALPEARTTGAWLFEHEVFPHANVKGSMFDHRMQHDCYPFVVYNMFVFWLMLRFISFPRLTQSLCCLFEAKSETARAWLLRFSEPEYKDLFAPEEILV
jgi:hypothetical protein